MQLHGPATAYYYINRIINSIVHCFVFFFCFFFFFINTHHFNSTTNSGSPAFDMFARTAQMILSLALNKAQTSD